MKIIRPVAFPVAIMLLCIGISHAQKSQPNPDTTVAQKDMGSIYIGRVDTGVTGFGFLFLTDPVYLGEWENSKFKQRKIAVLRGNRFLLLRLPPGKYTFDTRWMPGKHNLTVEAGGEYYLVTDRGDDCPEDQSPFFPPCESTTPSIKELSNEDGREQIRDLWPINAKDIKDSKVVSVPPLFPGTYHPEAYEKHK